MRLLVLALLFLAAPLAAQPDIAPYAARQIAPGVHLLATPPEYRGAVTGNITIIEQSDGLVVIDSGLTRADGRRAVAFIRSITRKPVKVLLYTHWHNDHPLGASEIRAAWPGVRIVSTQATLSALQGPIQRYIGLRPDERMETIFLNQSAGTLAFIAAQLRNPQHDEATRARYRRMEADTRERMTAIRGTYLVLPTESFTDELRIDDLVRPVHLRFLGRANTDGDAIAWLPNERIVVTGDIVVSPIPFGFFSFPGDWIAVLERIKALDYRILIPGHGEPQADTAYVDRLIATLADLRAQIAPLAAQGLSLEEVQRRVDWSAQRAIFGDTPRNRLLFDAYWLNPMTINTYMEARGTPMVQGEESLYPGN
ncbi:MAG TPA: MBL fold metallo-hydrolase [Allosphingosinicella sp.]|nr:MBL fold metallo-hydrolase [Allosphingosinicella sp.]